MINMINPVYSYSLHPPNRQSEASYPGWALLDQRPTLAGRPEWEANALRFTAVVSSFCYFRPVHGRSEDQLPMASAYPCYLVRGGLVGTAYARTLQPARRYSMGQTLYASEL